MAYTMASAHDIAVANSEGKTIYYNYNSDGSSVSVTYSTEYTGTVVIPETVTYSGQTYSVTSIGERAFHGCSGLTSVTIPNSVTSIGSYAFYRCSGLTSVTIPNSVTNIGTYAFRFCRGLTSVTISNSVTSIGIRTFSDCSSLTSVTIPNSVTSIGILTFSDCSSLTSVTIPNSVTSIDSGAFSGCSGLTGIKVANGNSVYDSRNDCNAIIETASNTIIIGCKTTIIPNSVTKIGSSAFSGCSGLTSITIPNSVTRIGSSAFEGCSGLTSVTIPNSVTSIGSYAFRGCSGLTGIKVAYGNSVYDSRNDCNAIIETASNTLVAGCKNTIIPNSVTSISSSAFYGCSDLTSVIIPNSVTSIGSSAFDGTAWFDNQPDGLVYAGNVAYRYKGTMPANTSIILKEGTVGISPSAFFDCSGLTSVTIGNGVTSIGSSAFYGCSGLTSVIIPNSVTSIGSSAFYNCSDLTSITIGNGVTSIGSYAFEGCENLTSIIVQAEIPPSYSLIEINTNATLYVPAKSIETYRTTSPWSNFANIQTIPSTITKNGTCGENLTWVFDDYTGVLTISGMGEMEDYDSNNEAPWTLIKDNIKEVIIENGVTGIAKRAFIDTELKYAIYKCKTPPTDSTGGFNPIADIIFVPEGSILEYKLRQEHYTGEVYPWVNADVEFYTNVTVDEYEKVMSDKDKATVTSVAMYDGMDENLTEAMIKDGMNPNCLYYIFSDKEITGDNIIDLKTCTANRIVLQSNNIFKCPVSFIATKAQFTYTPLIWANGFGGWETLCLPFEASAFKASESGYISPILLGAYGDFWLRQFVGASSKALYFSSTLDGTMKANTPYLLAFPGSVMGNGHLQGQTITFLGKNVEFEANATAEVQRNDKVFVGNYDNVADDASGWILNSTGSDLIASSVVGDKPFRAYFRTEDDFEDFNAAKALSISFVEDEETAIREINEDLDAENDLNIYSIDGTLIRKAENPSDSLKGLKKGAYIINRKKVMIR